MKEIEYIPSNKVCCRKINFTVVDNKITNLSFYAGCKGNLQGISALVEGMQINEVISRLEGITCGMRGTSCPDQLVQALRNMDK